MLLWSRQGPHRYTQVGVRPSSFISILAVLELVLNDCAVAAGVMVALDDIAALAMEQEQQ